MTSLEWTSDIARIPEGSLLLLMKEAVLGDESGWNFAQRSSGHVAAMFGPGMTGFFVLKGDELVAMARVMSDEVGWPRFACTRIGAERGLDAS
jgi:hypothetical protein